MSFADRYFSGAVFSFGRDGNEKAGVLFGIRLILFDFEIYIYCGGTW